MLFVMAFCHSNRGLTKIPHQGLAELQTHLKMSAEPSFTQFSSEDICLEIVAVVLGEDRGQTGFSAQMPITSITYCLYSDQSIVNLGYFKILTGFHRFSQGTQGNTCIYHFIMSMPRAGE